MVRDIRELLRVEWERITAAINLLVFPRPPPPSVWEQRLRVCLLAELGVFGWWRGSFAKPAKVMRPGSHVIQLETTDRGSAPKLTKKKKDDRLLSRLKDHFNTAEQGLKWIRIFPTLSITE